MPRLTHKLTAALLTFTIGVLAATLWLVLRHRDLSSHSPQPKVCEEWGKAERADKNLGWDLTYMTALQRLGICPGNFICAEWAKPQPPINKHIAEWQGDPIISSMEIELPDGHADMYALWFIRTKDQAYFWAFYPFDEDYSRGKHTISIEDYDRAFEAMACWQQDEPPNRVFGPKGYIGFLSLYKEGKSRQLLLTDRDLIEGNNEQDETPGRFSVIMRPLFTSLSARQRPAAAAQK